MSIYTRVCFNSSCGLEEFRRDSFLPNKRFELAILMWRLVTLDCHNKLTKIQRSGKVQRNARKSVISCAAVSKKYCTNCKKRKENNRGTSFLYIGSAIPFFHQHCQLLINYNFRHFENQWYIGIKISKICNPLETATTYVHQKLMNGNQITQKHTRSHKIKPNDNKSFLITPEYIRPHLITTHQTWSQN